MQQNILPSQGSVNYLEALDIAIEREIKAKFMYLMMAQHTKAGKLVTKLKFLADEEQSHRDNLEDLYKKISGKSKDFDSSVSFPSSEKVKSTAELELSELLKVAISKEKEAYEFYVELADNSADEGMKDLFRYLAEEESNHRRILEAELKLYTGERPMGNERSVEMVPGIYKEWW